MPELPEVETIRSQLTTYLPLQIEGTSKSKVIDSILHTKVPRMKGELIKKIERHGKCMIFHIGDKYLLSHLGMTGSWRISEDKIKDKHLHFTFKTKTHYLSYVDQRRFGHMYFFTKEELENYMSRLGPDINTKELSPKFIYTLFVKYPRRILKDFLLEQKFFAGSGNYIANEVCARAGLLPTRTLASLSMDDAKNIKKGFQSILGDSMKKGGVTFQGGYTDAFGDSGQGVQNLVVFHQKTCQMCGKAEVKKIMLKARGTYYCPHCQQ